MKNKLIWIDKEKAQVLTVLKDTVDMVSIPSTPETPAIEDLEKPGGATEIIKDRKVLERQKQQTKQFFDTLTSHLNDTKGFTIIGPAEMGQHFASYLDEQQPDLSAKLNEVLKSDKLTENQLKAKARELYSS
jgi:hypothetical protein